jgi:hypothetical protein
MPYLFWILAFTPAIGTTIWQLGFSKSSDDSWVGAGFVAAAAALGFALVFAFGSASLLGGPVSSAQAVSDANSLGADAVVMAQRASAPGPGPFVVAAEANQALFSSLRVVVSSSTRIAYSVSFANAYNHRVTWACLKAGTTTLTYSVTPGTCHASN